jgi:hypothetical protein
MASLAVLDGDAIHGVDQVDGTCNTEIAAREKGNMKLIIVYLCHSR